MSQDYLKSNTDKSRFRFDIPLDIIKADEKGWQISGVASTEDRDLQGEIVKQNGLDISVLKAGRGLFNYEHRSNPEDIVGLVEDANFIDKGLKVDGYLFRSHKRAQAIAEIMQSLKKGHEKRVQLSIEGAVINRDPSDKKVVKAARIENVAITFAPVNQNTYATFAKSLQASEAVEPIESLPIADPKDILISSEFESETPKSKEDINKTLTVGNSNVPPSDLSGGAALPKESLCGDSKPKKKAKKKYKAVVKKAILKSISDFMLEKCKTLSKDEVIDILKTEVLPRFEFKE